MHGQRGLRQQTLQLKQLGRGIVVDRAALLKLERLLKKFPETWTHIVETEKVDGGTRTFHHVDYKSGTEGSPKVRLVSYVSADLCELITGLKNAAAELLETARASLAAEKPKAAKVAKAARKSRKGSDA
jgi:hypothetical protein